MRGIERHGGMFPRRRTGLRELLRPVDAVPHPSVADEIAVIPTEHNHLTMRRIVSHGVGHSTWREILGNLTRPIWCGLSPGRRRDEQDRKECFSCSVLHGWAFYLYTAETGWGERQEQR